MDHDFSREIRWRLQSLDPRFRGGRRKRGLEHQLPHRTGPRALRAPVLAGKRLVGAMACRHAPIQKRKGSTLMRLRQTLTGLGGLALVAALIERPWQRC